MYTGQVDLAARLKGDKALSLIDLKTGQAVLPQWRPQLAAYWMLCKKNGIEVERVMTLRLSKTGGRALINEFTGSLASDTQGFMACLQAHQYFVQIRGKEYPDND
jgi:hypothetical protein